MPNPNAIVGIVLSIDPAIDGPGAEMFERHPDGFLLRSSDGMTARLLPGESAAGWLEILDDFRRAELPVYLEVDPETLAVKELYVPLVMRVARLTETEAGDVDVTLVPSHGSHMLRRNSPYFDEFLGTLQAAQAEGTLPIVTQNFDGEIVDVRPTEEQRPPPQVAERPGSIRLFIRRWLHWFEQIAICLRCITAQRAEELLDEMAARNCAPLATTAGCIPFLYPDDGCYARAHEMCRLLAAAEPNAQLGKVWIYPPVPHDLIVSTRNHPKCKVTWKYHVAPTVRVKKGFGFTERQVIDPSLFPSPVTIPAWKAVQGNRKATVIETDCTPLYRNLDGKELQLDPTHSETKSDLLRFRSKLKNSSLRQGPPPYAHCP